MPAPISVSYNPYSHIGEQISDEHFGLNFAYEYESFGDRPWDRFDEVVNATGVRAVRYPGGSEAEEYFDIRNPNATSVTLPNGSVRETTPLAEFLDYTNANNLQAIVIIPTNMALTDTYIGGFRDFDPAWEQDIYDFVMETLAESMPAGIQSFELGNEYPTYMTPVEYGRVASRMATIVDEAINDFWEQELIGNSLEQPSIAVQIWYESPGGGMSVEDLIANNQTVMDEFSVEEIAVVDAVIGHYYYYEGLHSGEINEHSYFNIEASIQVATNLMNAWQSNTQNDIEFIVSEWNVSFQRTGNTGLSQIPVLLEMFSSFISSGIDYLDFWSAQYNSTSLAAANGDLYAAGELFSLMTTNLIGTHIADVSVVSDTIDIHAFEGDDQLVVFVSSISTNEQTIELLFPDILDEFQLVSSTTVSVDASSADGVYRDQFDIPIYLEPDVSIELMSTSVNGMINGDLIGIDLAAYETTMLILHRIPPNLHSVRGTNGDDILLGTDQDDLIIGSSGDDLLEGGAGSDLLEGGPGNDIFIFDSSSESARISDLELGIDTIDLSFLLEHQNSLILSIGDETFLVGSEIHQGATTAYFVDVTTDEEGSSLIVTNANGDTTFTLELTDVAVTESINQFLSTLHFGSSVNISHIDNSNLSFQSFLTEATSESILRFEISQESQADRLAIDEFTGANRIVLGQENQIRFVSDEGAVTHHRGTSSDEQIYGSNDEDWIFAGGGDDYLDGGLGRDYLYGNEGNDAIFGRRGNDTIDGGEGEDLLYGGDGADILMGGDGNDILVGGIGSDSMEGGEGADMFVFFSHEVGGNDNISDFIAEEDTLMLYGTSFSDLTIVASGDGVIVSWADHTITLDNVAISNITEDCFLFV